MTVACPSCGEENRADRKFCLNCGTRLERACPSCGTPNEAGARFCGECGTALEADAPAATFTPRPTDATAERRLVSVLFADLVGFTTLAEDRDPEAVRELLTRYFDTATEVIAVHGGTVEKFIGDAVMAVWGTPIAHEDDAERAVRAGLELVDAVAGLHPGLRARAGILTGEAAVTLNATNQGMVAGDLVNTAARLQGVAEAGTVLVGEATRRAAEQSVVFEPIGEHSLKGKTSPIPAWRALRVVAQRGGEGRSDGLEPPFVGRDEELRQLKEALHAVGRERRPRLVSITGTGGIGKSRLAWELLKYIDGISDDVYWHRGRSPSYGEGIAFWALGEMVRRRAELAEGADEASTRERIRTTLEEYVPDASERERIGPALLSLLGVQEAPAGGRDALFPAWRTFFERIAERGTTVLVFEDLQWADSGLLDFIDHLLDWTRGLPIMVVTLARPELFDRRPDWGAGRRQLTALSLEPLSDEDVRELLEGLVPGLPADALAAIVGRAEGVPLYAVEMVRGLLADGLIERQGETYAVVGDLSRLRVPDSLRSLIASRLDALDPDDRSLLQDASVLGQVFSADALAAVTGTDRDALEGRLRGLVRREVLDVETDPRSPERGQYRFVQELIREVAYGTLARRDRRSRHLAVARHYEAAGDDETAGALASHYVAAHAASDEGAEAGAVAAQARLALTAAADRATALGSPRQAVAFAAQALELTDDPTERAALLDRAASAAASAGMAEGMGYAEAAVAAYRDAGDAVAALLAVARHGRVLIDATRLDQAVAVLEAGLAEADGLKDRTPLALLCANLSRAYMRLGHMEQAIIAADRALPIAEAADLRGVVAEAFANKGSALGNTGRYLEGVALLTAAVDHARRVGDRHLEVRARNNLGALLNDDTPIEATEAVDVAVEIARDIGDFGMYQWMVGNQMASVWGEGREWDRRLADVVDAYERATMQTDRHRLYGFIVGTAARRGEPVEELLAAHAELGEGLEGVDAIFTRKLPPAIAAYVAGDARRAFDIAKSVFVLESQAPEIPGQLMLRAAIASGNPELIREAATGMLALPPGGAWRRAQLMEARAALAFVEGMADDAERDFVTVERDLADMGLNFDAFEVALCALAILPHSGALRAAAAAYRPMLETLRARPFLERLDALLGAPQVARPPIEPAAAPGKRPAESAQR